MKNMRLATLTFGAIGMCLLILDAKTALSSGAEGIKLCISTVIPSLFPFFILSAMINSTLFGTKIPILGALSRLPKRVNTV